MGNAVYLEKNGTGNDAHFEYFICKLSEDEKNVDVSNTVVAREAFKNVFDVEQVAFKNCSRIEEFAFESCKDLKNVIWQDADNKNNTAIKNIWIANIANLEVQHGAFKNCSKLQTVIFPAVSEKIVIEKETFAGCRELRTIVFYGSWNVDISEEAFIGCSNLTFLCSANSPAERYAREHGFRIVAF